MSLPYKHTYDSMGTRWEITVWDGIEEKRFQELCAEIEARSKQFDETFSRFIPTSLVSRLAGKIGEFEVPRDFTAMLRIYQSLYAATDKKLTPLIGFAISDLGYDADYSLIPKPVIRPVPHLDEAVEGLDETHIRIRLPALFDFGALGKGYFVDKIAEFLQENGIKRFLVNGSGDIFYEGNGEPIRAGLEHPGDTSTVVGVVEITRGAFCASGGNRRKWRGYHHIIDPDTLRSPEGISATWVMADTAATADAIATGLFFCLPHRIQTVIPFEYAILERDMRLHQSAGFHAETF